MQQSRKIILASESPRRREILATAGIEFEVAISPYDEPPLALPARDIAKTHAFKKAEALALELRPEWQDAIFIGVDTIVVAANGEILYKPLDRDDAERMLKLQSNSTVTVLSGFAVIDKANDRDYVDVELTEVFVAEISAQEIAWYLDTGEWQGKSGGFAIQGLASRFFSGVHGDLLNVVGLPLNRLYQILKSWQVFVA